MRKTKKRIQKFKLHLRCRLNNTDALCFDIRIPRLGNLFKKHLKYDKQKKRYLLPVFDSTELDPGREFVYHIQLLAGDISKGISIQPRQPVARANIDSLIETIQNAARDIIQEIMIIEQQHTTTFTFKE